MISTVTTFPETEPEERHRKTKQDWRDFIVCMLKVLPKKKKKKFKIEVNSSQSATKPPDSCFCKTNTGLGHIQGGIWLDHQSLTILW